MINDKNKAYCDLAFATCGKGWVTTLAAMQVVSGDYRGSVLRDKSDIPPHFEEAVALMSFANDKIKEIEDLISKLGDLYVKGASND